MPKQHFVERKESPCNYQTMSETKVQPEAPPPFVTLPQGAYKSCLTRVNKKIWNYAMLTIMEMFLSLQYYTQL